MTALTEAKLRLFDAATRVGTARDLRNEDAHRLAQLDLEEARAEFRRLLDEAERSDCSCTHARMVHLHGGAGIGRCLIEGCLCTDYEGPS